VRFLQLWWERGECMAIELFGGVRSYAYIVYDQLIA
jgi:hypothetical protein